MASVRIWYKKQLRIDHLSIPQLAMFKIGTVGVAAVKNRVTSAIGPTDGSAKPLTKGYAIRKTRLGRGNRRTLLLSGSMLNNLQIRTVSENRAKASLSTRKDRIKAWANQKIERWMVFSPKNRAAVTEAARRIFRESTRGILLQRWLGGRQQ